MRVDTVPVAHSDERGEIRNIVPGVAVLTSKRGSVRSNHVHKIGFHWIYVVSGRMLYLQKVGETVYEAEIGPGMKVFTAPGIPHRTEFLEDSVILSVGPNWNADPKKHLDDTIQVDWP
jgi:quercetin dioxygenase-like cupin family protein